MKMSLSIFGILAAIALSGCVSAPKPEGRPLTYIIRTKPALDTPIDCNGCWASLSTVDKNGYFLFFSQTRSAPRLTEYFNQLENGSGCEVLKDADIYVGSQLNVPLFLFGCHSWSDLAFSNGGL